MSIGNRWTGPALVAIFGLAMLGWTWGTWPDVLIDFGTQLYIAWQIAAGKVLFTDIFYFKGPLSPYLNALWFQLFGVSLRTLVLCNLAIASAALCLLYRLLSDISDRVSATLACLVFVGLFGFGQLAQMGNYNFICPYSHEVTHGVALGLLAIACLAGYHRTRSLRWVAGSGASIGCVFLTEAPIFLAASVALAAGFALTIWAERPNSRRIFQLAAVGAGSVVAAPVAAFILLCRVMPADRAWLGTLGSWPWIARGEVFALPFYKTWMGTQDISGSLGIMFAWVARYLMVFGPALVCGFLLRKPDRRRIGISVVVMLAVGGIVFSHLEAFWSGNLARPLPFLMLAIGAALFVLCARSRDDPRAFARFTIAFVMTVFAFALMWKMALYARIYNYGFAMAMPAALLFVAAVVGWLPALIANRGGNGGIVQGTAVMVVLLAVGMNLLLVQANLDDKHTAVGGGADAFLTDDRRGPVVHEALKEIAARIGPHETLAVLPHGAMFNYLSRRVNSTPYPDLDPILLGVADEDHVLAALKARPPDYIAVVTVNLSAHGAKSFGDDFCPGIYSWVRETYREIRVIGADPFRGGGFGVLLLKRAHTDHFPVANGGVSNP